VVDFRGSKLTPVSANCRIASPASLPGPFGVVTAKSTAEKIAGVRTIDASRFAERSQRASTLAADPVIAGDSAKRDIDAIGAIDRDNRDCQVYQLFLVELLARLGIHVVWDLCPIQ
jgi:hypothetical protein